MLIKGANAFFPDEGVFRTGDLRVENGKIAEWGQNLPGEGFDASGMFLTPGLIEAHSHIGICEEVIGWAGDDLCETSPLRPECAASTRSIHLISLLPRRSAAA